MKRSVTSALVAVALLAGVACSGGGGVTPGSGPKVSMTTPKGVSPALIKAAPMAKTVIQPASAMLTRHPATAIVPQSWSQIPGAATAVTAGGDGSIYVLSDQPSGADKYIWRYNAGTWTNIPGLASEIAVSGNGTLYAVNSGGGIFAYTGTWANLGGGAGSVAVASDNSVYVTSNGSGDQPIWHYASGSWTQAPGSGVYLAGSVDTTSHVIGGNTLAPNGIYILNSAGAIYYLNADNSFAQLPANASIVASRPGGLFALGSGAINPGGNQLFYFDLDTPGWSVQTGAAVSIAVGLGNVLYAISGSGGIYQTNTGTPTPGPTPTATPTATPTSTPTSTPTASPTPGAALVVSPNPISLTQTGNAGISVSETGFNGSITAVSGDTNIFTVGSPATMSGGSATLVINALTAGSTTLTVSDGTQQTVVAVHVTLTGVVINKAH